jgi:hypothetical protein
MRRALLLLPLAVLGPFVLTSCGNPATPAGYVGYLTRGAIVGKASYVGLQTGPTSYGASWLVKVMNVSVTPFSYEEDFSGDNAVLTKDKLMVSFRAHTIFRVRGDRVKEFVEQYTTLGEGPNQVQVAFANYLKEPLRTEIREAVAHYDAFPLNENIGRISNELTRWAQEKTKDGPFEVMNVVVGNLQYPAVVSQAVSNKLAVSQDLETRATQVEIARKDAGHPDHPAAAHPPLRAARGHRGAEGHGGQPEPLGHLHPGRPHGRAHRHHDAPGRALRLGRKALSRARRRVALRHPAPAG